MRVVASPFTKIPLLLLRDTVPTSTLPNETPIPNPAKLVPVVVNPEFTNREEVNPLILAAVTDVETARPLRCDLSSILPLPALKLDN